MENVEVTTKLNTIGWCVVAASAKKIDILSEEVRAYAETLGRIEPGRKHQMIERVEPQTPETAYAGSLSNAYGLGPLPLHTDTAHWPVPCRYLVMACASVGPTPTPTVLLKVRDVRLSEQEASACASAVFLIQNGRRSFYGHILDPDREYVRIDPGCMKPISSEGNMAFNAFSAARNAEFLYRHEWNVGEILIIDNWRVVHGRGTDRQTEHGRVLLRAMVR